MKFVELILKNFKPYYEFPDKAQKINLFDEKISNKNITLNIGQTGHGKTSISEAILWCIYGDTFPRNIKELVNSMAVDIAKQNKEKSVDLSVELIIRIQNEKYRLLRKCTFEIDEDSKNNDSMLSIIHDGVPLPQPEVNNFIRENFPTLKLMYYFVFDADDILKKFEENREGAIRDHINKFAGVEKLDDMIKYLMNIHELYDSDIQEIESMIHGDISEKISQQEGDINLKKEALGKLTKQVSDLQKDKRDLFHGSPSKEVQKFSELVDKKDRCEKKIDELDKEFYDVLPVSNLDLILLSKIIEKTIEKLSEKQTTEEEFESSIKLLKSSITKNYTGILLKGDDGTKLIKKGTKILEDCLEDCDCLALGKGEGSKNISLQTFIDYRDRSLSQKNTFEDYRNKFTFLLDDLIKTRNQLSKIGDTTQDREAKKKYDQYNKIEGRIKDKQDTKSAIEETIGEIEKEIKDLREKLSADENQRKEIDSIKMKQEKTSELLKIAQNSRSKYLDTLLNQVNKLSSEFLREVVKDKNRFHSIEIDSNYHFKVKQRNGNELEEGQINRGNVQLSMMSFFFGLSKFLAKKIPYVIDDPLLRLDPGHDKRLIKQLSTINEQIIFHMIPGKEYTTDSYKWLKSHINIQNWLYRENYRDISEVSHAEKKNPDEMIEFDIDKF